jgi:hypothetical protein
MICFFGFCEDQRRDLSRGLMGDTQLHSEEDVGQTVVRSGMG